MFSKEYSVAEQAGEKLQKRWSEILDLKIKEDSDLKIKEINPNISTGTVTDWAMGYFMLL